MDSESEDDQDDEVEEQEPVVKKRRHDLEKLHDRIDQLQQAVTGTGTVSSILSQVRYLASKSTATNDSLLAAVEALADTVTVTNHPNAEEYRECVKELWGLEDSPDFRTLVIKMFGSPSAKKVASLVASWKRSLLLKISIFAIFFNL